MTKKITISNLKVSHKIRIRFNETDPVGIVWHGNYLKYFEEGREAFGRHYKISYLDQKSYGFTSPIVKSSCEHKLPLYYGNEALIETTYINCPSTKLVFEYKIFNNKNELVCTGKTTQIFLDKNGNLSLTDPDFYFKWKKENSQI